jgi:hypothetical protein
LGVNWVKNMEKVDWTSIINLVFSRATELIFGAIGGLIAAWIAYKFGIKSEIIKIGAELNQSIEKERIIKESQILDELWTKTRALMEKGYILTARLKQFPDFAYLNGGALNELLQSSFLSERQRKELIESPDRNKYYQRAKNWFEYNETITAFNILNTFVQSNRIHVPVNLLQDYDKLIKAFNELLISYEIWFESRDHKLLMQTYTEIEQAKEIVSIIEQQTRVELNKYKI